MRKVCFKAGLLINQISKKSGITLTELLVASILVGIIMLGVMAFGISLTQMEGSSSRSSILAMKSVSILSSIRKDFNLTTGDGTDWGLMMGSPSSGVKYVSFRQDLNSSPDPSRYDEDSWIIYIANINTYKLKRCVQPITNPAVPKSFAIPNESANCSDSNSTVLTTGLVVADFKFVIDGKTWTNMAQLPINSNSKNQCVLNITLTTQHDPASLIVDPIRNPKFTLMTSIMSSSHSW